MDFPETFVKDDVFVIWTFGDRFQMEVSFLLFFFVFFFRVGLELSVRQLA